jgi:hypothetical protein
MVRYSATNAAALKLNTNLHPIMIDYPAATFLRLSLLTAVLTWSSPSCTFWTAATPVSGAAPSAPLTNRDWPKLAAAF